MLDIKKQRAAEFVTPKKKAELPVVPQQPQQPQQVIERTITRTIQQPAPEPTPSYTESPGYQAGLRNIHGPGGARDPEVMEPPPPRDTLAELLSKPVEETAADWVPEPEPEPDLRPGARQYAESPGTEEMVETINAKAATEYFAAIAAEKRQTLLADAGLTEENLASAVRNNPGKTEEYFIAINMQHHGKGTYAGDFTKLIGGHLAVAKRQISEALSGSGEHVLPGIGGNAPGMNQELNGTERFVKVLQAVAMPVLNTLATGISYATGEVAQTAAMANPLLAPRLFRKMQEAGLDPYSSDNPNLRLEIVTESLMESYMSSSASGFDSLLPSAQESNAAAVLLVARGYLEVLAGGSTPGVVGLVKAPFKLTGTGVVLARNAARRSKFNAARAQINASGGLERRIGAQGAVSGGVSQRLLAVAAVGGDAPTVARMSALAKKISARESVTPSNTLVDDADLAIKAYVSSRKKIFEAKNSTASVAQSNAKGVSARLGKLLRDEEGGELSIPRVGVSDEGLRVGKIVIGQGTDLHARASKAGGYFQATSGDFVITPKNLRGSSVGKRQAVSTAVHEIVHVGQWLASGRNVEKFIANADIERLPSQVQEVVLRLMGVSIGAMTDPNIAKVFRQRGVRGQIVDAIRKWADDEAGGAAGKTKKPRSSLDQYADNGLENRLRNQLNRLQADRYADNAIFSSEELKAGKFTPPSQKEKDIVDRILDLTRQDDERSTGMARPPKRGEASGTNAPGDVAPTPRTTGEHADEVYRLTMSDPDNIGATYSLRKGDMTGEDAWSVGAYPERAVTITGRDVTPGDLERFISKNEDILKRDPELAVGTYKDPATGDTTLDIVKTPSVEKFLVHTTGTVKGEFPGSRVPSDKAALSNARAKAKDQAIQISKENGQDSIYNLRTGQTLLTPKSLAQTSDVNDIVQRVRSHGTPTLFTKAAKWYTNAREFARAMSSEADFTPSSVPLRNVAAAMAALSSQNEWAGVGKMDNLKSIYKLLRAYERGDTGPFQFEEGMSLSGAAVNKAWRALTSKGDPMDELVGAKERSFALNILDEKDMATIDRHIGKGNFGLKNPEQRPSVEEHARLQAAYKASLAELKADGTVPEDFNVRDLQAADWGLLSQNELDFWTPMNKADTMFPGTPAEKLPYKASEGDWNWEDEPDFTPGDSVGAPGDITPRPSMGGMSTKAFSKYKDIRTLVKTIQETSGGKYKGIKDFNDAIKRGDIEGMPEPLVKDFIYGNVEKELAHRNLPDDEIRKIVDDTLERIKGNCV